MKPNIINKISKKEAVLISVSLFAGLLFGAVFLGNSETEQKEHSHLENAVQETIYTCSMHPQIRQNKPGSCPICAMDLVPVMTHALDEADPNEIQMPESAVKLANIQTAKVKRGIPQKSLHLLGRVTADERNTAKITARFGGRIEKLFVNYTGREVRKGERLASIYSPEMISVQKELLEAVNFKDSKPAFYGAARSKLKLWGLTEYQINALENSDSPKLYHDIISPLSGTVVKREVTAGGYIKEGSVLFEIIDLSRVWVVFDAYETDLPWIKIGSSIEFSMQAFLGEKYFGTVSYIDPVIDAQTRTARIRIETPNHDHSLKPGMFADGVLAGGLAEDKEVLLIPKSAILWTGKRSIVYVKVPERDIPAFLLREIVLGPEAGNYYMAAEGLSEGEAIAVNGVFKIDASAQLAGKVSMMSPEGGIGASAHQHGDMKMDIEKIDHSKHKIHAEHQEFKVFGNCGMCEDRIENAATSVEGVNFADWDQETKIIKVNFDKLKTDLDKIHRTIAKVGHDTKLYKTDHEVYNNLHQCCKYDRPE